MEEVEREGGREAKEEEGVRVGERGREEDGERGVNEVTEVTFLTVKAGVVPLRGDKNDEPSGPARGRSDDTFFESGSLIIFGSAIARDWGSIFTRDWVLAMAKGDT